MATRTCPDCGAQYVATVRRCIDCDVVLVEETSGSAEAESTATPMGDGDQVGYELEGWGNQLKVTLEGMLDNAGIHRAWEAGALVVAAQDEEAVDDLIATLEGGDVAELDDDTPKVALEIEGLDADGQAELDARLIADAVPHAWDDEGALLVAEDDEERVLAIVDDVLDGPVDETDGLAAVEAMGSLFVAVDRLLRSPTDPGLTSEYHDAAVALEGLTVPYGFTTEDWDGLVAEAAALDARLVPATASKDPADEAEAEADEDDGDSGQDDGDESGIEAGDSSEDEPGDGDTDDEEPSGDPAPEEEPVLDQARRLRDRLAPIV